MSPVIPFRRRSRYPRVPFALGVLAAIALGAAAIAAWMIWQRSSVSPSGQIIEVIDGDILRGQFDAESSRASDPSVAALFAELARTADDIPDVLADAYSELFDDLYSSEIEMKMTWQTGIQWWPKNAT